MSDYNNVKYNVVRKEINKLIKEERSKESILNGGNENNYTLEEVLNFRKSLDNWPNITEEDWIQLVEIEIAEHESMLPVFSQEGVIFKEGEENDFQIPTSRNSTWQLFKSKTLKEQSNFDDKTINAIEEDVRSIVVNLSTKTEKDKPVKGLVIGSVQSGKTTNMAALMAMASDYGFNMFIILSGMVDNLREQNEKRIYEMLNTTSGKRINWTRISQQRDHLDRLNQIYSDNKALFTVVLKNKNRLEQLMDWIQEDHNYASKLKILVIDDESDQASVSTTKNPNYRRSTINGLISNLIHGKTKRGRDYRANYESVNYIGYTATPYANILSESPDNKMSLYPSKFIRVLSKSNRYMGPLELFGEVGTENEGVDIFRMIEEPINLNELYNEYILPEDLKDSIAYFIGASASLRKHQFGKPVSMLVQASHKIDDHSSICQSIIKWFENKNDVYNHVIKVWEREFDLVSKKNFNGKVFLDQNTLNPHNVDEIKDSILNIISEISPVKIGSHQFDYKYHNGVHIVVDNSDDSFRNPNKEYRLQYPTREEDLKKTPIFLIIGGNTMSRGITVEGLVSTYFIRRPSAADTLTQMGRWFGYRIGYELYPRIWLSRRTHDQFQYVSTVEKELRDEILDMNKRGFTPSNVGPKIKYLPQYINLTSNTKSRHMKSAKYNFTGYSSQTYIFDKDENIQKNNIKIAEEFINNLGNPEIIERDKVDGVVWRNVKPEMIINNLFNKFHFNKRIKSLNNIEELNEWILKSTKNKELDNWNVILGGIGKANQDNNNWFINSNLSYNKIRRTKKEQSLKDEINIGVLRGPSDLFNDIDRTKYDEEINNQIEEAIKSGKRDDYNKVRELLKLDKIPQLFIYRIDKDSKPDKGSSRQELDIDCDLIGIYISIPGSIAKSFTTYVTIKISKDNMDILEDGDVDSDDK